MNLYEITIQPTGGLGTALKGDTIFGHFCWQAAYDPGLLKGDLDKYAAAHREKPFVVFSSAFPRLTISSADFYLLKRPDLPMFFFPLENESGIDRLEEVKRLKKKRWMLLEKGARFDISPGKLLTDHEVIQQIVASADPETRERMRVAGPPEELITPFPQSHNTINRQTWTTGTGVFAPYSRENSFFYIGAVLSIFVLIDEAATGPDDVMKGMRGIGEFGYGRDASTGMGRFKCLDIQPASFPAPEDADACYTLAPCAPKSDRYDHVWFTPFVRHGRHGDVLARSVNPFKRPVLMAEEGAVFEPKKEAGLFKKPYLGRGVTGVSKAHAGTIVQGYAPYIPFKLER